MLNNNNTFHKKTIHYIYTISKFIVERLINNNKYLSKITTSAFKIF